MCICVTAPVAQLVEQSAFNRKVMGSSPVGGSDVRGYSSIGRIVDFKFIGVSSSLATLEGVV